jgi:hypothetical protein
MGNKVNILRIPRCAHAVVFSLNGKLMVTGADFTAEICASVRPGNAYIVENKSTGAAAKLMMAPTAR